jgi:transcriptional regulator with XRE-family HTH domain
LNDNRLGQRIAAARRRAGLKQDALAAAVGVHAVTVSKWERGEQEPYPDTLRLLADVLGVSVYSLAGGDMTDSVQNFEETLLALIHERNMDERVRAWQMEVVVAKMRADALRAESRAAERRAMSIGDEATGAAVRAQAVAPEIKEARAPELGTRTKAPAPGKRSDEAEQG